MDQLFNPSDNHKTLSRSKQIGPFAFDASVRTWYGPYEIVGMIRSSGHPLAPAIDASSRAYAIQRASRSMHRRSTRADAAAMLDRAPGIRWAERGWRIFNHLAPQSPPGKLSSDFILLHSRSGEEEARERCGAPLRVVMSRGNSLSLPSCFVPCRFRCPNQKRWHRKRRAPRIRSRITF